jgi:hypothetical protein
LNQIMASGQAPSHDLLLVAGPGMIASDLELKFAETPSRTSDAMINLQQVETDVDHDASHGANLNGSSTVTSAI